MPPSRRSQPHQDRGGGGEEIAGVRHPLGRREYRDRPPPLGQSRGDTRGRMCRYACAAQRHGCRRSGVDGEFAGRPVRRRRPSDGACDRHAGCACQLEGVDRAREPPRRSPATTARSARPSPRQRRPPRERRESGAAHRPGRARRQRSAARRQSARRFRAPAIGGGSGATRRRASGRAGRNENMPPRPSSSIEKNSGVESIHGQQSHATLPSGSMSAAVLQSARSACSPIGCCMRPD